MSDSFQFPKHPLSGHKDPFKDDKGENPYADPDGPGELKEDPYATPDLGEAPKPQLGDYERTLAARGVRVLWLGIVGLLCGGLGLAGIGVTLFGRLTWLGNFSLTEAIPLSLLGFGFALAAWVLGSHDRRAIKLGAMPANQSGTTRVGHLLGMLIAIVCLVVYLALFIFFVLRLVWG